MSVMTAMIILSDDARKGGAISSMDVIEHDGKHWLVPEWLDNKAAKVRIRPVKVKPTRVRRRSFRCKILEW